MEPKIKDIKKWVTALRSGKYEQTEGKLQNDAGFCCLGVACDIFIPKNEIRRFDGMISGTMPEEQESSPDWISNASYALYDITGVGLTSLNDGVNEYNIKKRGKYSEVKFTFNEIADLLELVYIHKAFEEA